VREDEGREKEDDGLSSLLSTDVYDAMKEKRQFIIMRNGRQQDAAVFSDLYLEALDEELVTLRSSISWCRPASMLKAEELGEETQSGESQIVRERDYTLASSVESTLRIIV